MSPEGQVTLRLRQPADAAAIRAINSLGAPGVSPLTPSEIAALATGAIRCWVAEDGGQVVGYVITYTAQDDYDGEEFGWFQQHIATFVYIDQVAVAPSHQRRGVAQALYLRLAEDARAQGIDTLTCEVNLDPPNPTSLAFHDRQGFTSVGGLPTHDGRIVNLLQKTL